MCARTSSISWTRKQNLAAGLLDCPVCGCGMIVSKIEHGLSLELFSEQETERLGQALADMAGPGTVVGLVGPLGTGKTRLARAIAERLGVDPTAIASPT